MERSLLDMDPAFAHLMDLVSAVSEQAGGHTRLRMQDAAVLKAWTDLPDPAALAGIEDESLEETVRWYRQSPLPGLVKNIFLLGALEQQKVPEAQARRWFENALQVWSLSFLDFPFDAFWQVYEDRITGIEDETEWVSAILEEILTLQNETYGRLRHQEESEIVLVVAVDYDEEEDRYFADVEARLPLSHTAIRQLMFVSVQYCEDHRLAPMDEDGGVFVLGLKQERDSLVPEVQALEDLTPLVEEILRIVRAE